MKKATATNAVFAALAKWGDKNSERDAIPAGDYTATVTVLAKCDRYTINETAELTLSVGEDSTQSRAVKVKPQHVLGLVFDLCGKSVHDKLNDALAAQQTPSEENVELAALVLKQSAKTTSTKVRGAVTLAVE